jgi:beta-carotene hydroxylase
MTAALNRQQRQSSSDNTAKPANPDRQTMEIARQHSGKFSWTTMIFSVVLILSHVVLLYLSVVGAVSVGLAVFGLSVLTYALYTTVHESVHNNISGNQKHLTWADDLFGRCAGILIIASDTAHKGAHFAHHSKTNNPEHDPDMVFGNGKPHQVLWGALTITLSEYHWYFKNKWAGASRREKNRVIFELGSAVGLRLGIALAGFPLEAFLFGVLPNLLGMMIVALIFAWAVHRPHNNQKRYLNTSTIVFNRWADTPITYLWLFQNYHSIHHLFPNVPFHQYRKVFKKIEPVMQDKGAPIYRIGH